MGVTWEVHRRCKGRKNKVINVSSTNCNKLLLTDNNSSQAQALRGVPIYAIFFHKFSFYDYPHLAVKRAVSPKAHSMRAYQKSKAILKILQIDTSQ